MKRNISDNGLNLIKCMEGLKTQAYKCPAGVWTVGYGHTRTAYQGMTVTFAQADDLLRSDVKVSEAAVNRYVKDCTQNQFDALVSFVFNVGAGNFKNSTMLRLINEGRPAEEVAAEFGKWIYVKGKVSQGLVNRREFEKALYLS